MNFCKINFKVQGVQYLGNCILLSQIYIFKGSIFNIIGEV